MRLSKTSLTIALSLAALAIAGCGGGGDSTATTAATTEATPAPSKAELISQGDAICGEVNAAAGSIGASEAEVPQQITQVAGLYIGMVENLKDLGAPDEDAGYAEFIEAAEELSATQSATKLATEREDTVAIGEATEKAAPALEEFESVAGEYGFEAQARLKKSKKAASKRHRKNSKKKWRRKKRLPKKWRRKRVAPGVGSKKQRRNPAAVPGAPPAASGLAESPL
jgi:hypothetical protein